MSYLFEMADQEGQIDWTARINARGIAGLGNSETDEEKSIIERSQICEFADTVNQLNSVNFSNIEAADPPLPDFTCQVDDHTIHVELTEFIDPKLVERAKHILATPSEELYDSAKKFGLTFEPNFNWFSKILSATIEKKDQKYAKRPVRIDVLLIYNEAIELNDIDIGKWLDDFEIQKLSGINSVYFKNWRQPDCDDWPVWSMMAHPSIGKLTAG